MKRMRRAASWLLTAVLVLGLFSPPPARAAEVYFTSINDHLAALTVGTMPVWSDDVLYVPYTVFQSATNGGNDLGLVCSYNRNSGIFTIFNLNKMLSFNLSTGDCWNEMTGDSYSARGILRNNTPYLSLAKVCEFFDLNYSYTPIPYIYDGYLVRIKNEQVVFSDADFISTANSLVKRRLREYSQELISSNTPEPPKTPQPPQRPVTPPSVEPAFSVSTYLAFRCDSSDGISRILTTLRTNDTYALFFLTPELIAQNRDLVRQIIGSGHSLGIWVNGANTEESILLLNEANRLLEGIVYSRTTLVLAPSGQRDALEDSGWVCWNNTLSLMPSSSVSSSAFASYVLDRLSGRTRDTFLSIDCSNTTARILSTLLTQLEGKNFVVSIPMETNL